MPGSGTRTGNSMAEYLTGVLQDVAYAQTLPDADLEYLTNLQATILAKLREPMEAAMQSAQSSGGAPPLGSATPQGPPPGMGGPLGAPPMGAPPGLPAAGGAPELPPGLRNGIAMPNPDELRRLVGGM
jgi:hypothetical protein